MAISFSSNLTKASPSVPYLLEDVDLRGGFRVVADVTARDAMHVLNKKEGMVVFCVAEAQYFRWTGADWAAWDITALVSTGTGLSTEGNVISVDTAHLNTLYAAVDHNHSFDSLSNVNVTDIADGEVVRWDQTSGKWVNATLAEAGISASAHNHNIVGLSDVVVTDVANGELLRWDTTTSKWINSTLTEAGIAAANHNHSFDSLENVAITDLTDGEMVRWDQTSGKWVNTTIAEAGIAPSVHGHTWAAITDVPQVSTMPGVTVSTSDPLSTDGTDGDIWFVVPA